jgi:hypothetical protein
MDFSRICTERLSSYHGVQRPTSNSGERESVIRSKGFGGFCFWFFTLYFSRLTAFEIETFAADGMIDEERQTNGRERAI